MSKTVQFTDTSTNANTYYWQFGDGNTSGDRNPIHTYEEYGDYVVILTITDNNGNSDEFQQNVSLSLPNVDEPPVDETTEEETTEETTDEETSYEDDTEETTTEETSDWPEFLNAFGYYNLQKLEQELGNYTATDFEDMIEMGVITFEQANIILELLGRNPLTQTTTTTTTETETESDDSDTDDIRPTFDYTLTGMLSGRQSGVNTTFNIDVDSVNYPTLIPELSNYIGQTMTANGAPRTITNFQTSGTGYAITLQGIVGNDTPGARYSFSINITSLQDLSGNNDGGGYGDDDTIGTPGGGRPGPDGP